MLSKTALMAGCACLLVACNPVSYVNGYLGWPDDNPVEEGIEYVLDMPDLTPDSPE